MSIKSFFESVGSEIEKLFKSVVSSSWEQKASATIKYVAPLVETIVQLAAGTAAAAAVTGVINQVQADLATVSVVVQGGKVAAGTSAAATVQAALTSVNTNMAALLADADVKNSAKAADIEATTNLITGEVSAILSNLPSA